MTIKLMLLKSGEDLIADVAEMAVGEGENIRVVGYYLTKPCLVRMRNPNTSEDKKTGFEVSLYPWIPLSADEKISIPAEWLVTMVEPTIKLKEMYIEDVIEYGKDSKDSGTNEQSDSNQQD